MFLTLLFFSCLSPQIQFLNKISVTMVGTPVSFSVMFIFFWLAVLCLALKYVFTSHNVLCLMVTSLIFLSGDVLNVSDSSSYNIYLHFLYHVD